VISDVGIIPELIVLTTSPPPIIAPKKTKIAHKIRAFLGREIAPEPYATPIEAAAPLAPMFIAKKRLIMIAIVTNIVYFPLLMEATFCFHLPSPSARS
jgi:hypothetical protein